MNKENEKVYSEVYNFLNSIDEEYKLKVPKKLRDFFKENRDLTYSVKYDVKIPIYKQNISKKAISIIALLHLNYWCNDEKEKQDLMKLFNENYIKKEEEKRKKYSTDILFKKHKKD